MIVDFFFWFELVIYFFLRVRYILVLIEVFVYGSSLGFYCNLIFFEVNEVFFFLFFMFYEK